MKYYRFLAEFVIIIAFVRVTWAADTASVDLSKLPAAAARKIDFVSDIQPLLAQSCFKCHGKEKQEGGLRLDVRSRALAGGDSGQVLLPGKGSQSRLLHLVAGLDEDSGRMPPEGEGEALSTEQVSVLRAWIDAGIEWPDELAGEEQTTQSKHWSFQPPARPDVPAVQNPAWVRNPIDAFVLAKLEQEHVSPSPEADRVTLLRRVYLDLIGLLPTPDQIDAFLGDDRPDAYERCVDQLLESPHYGERWGRHWLDAARYADTDGYEQDHGRPNAWRYRDWVISAVNRDMPFDIFTVQQLAGDLLTPADPEYDAAAFIGTGFHRNTLINKEGGVDPEEDRVKRTVDRTNTLGTVWMGLSVGCANCHSHKYDPISQREYFGLYAFFNSLDEKDLPISPDQPKDLAQTVTQPDDRRETYLHLRGDFLAKGPIVAEHTPAALPKLKSRNDHADRLDLARWLVSAEHPLTARVTVNRVWQKYFGRGLVATPDDFGTQGEPPSHPELLDWLAIELREGGWRKKRIHRLIVTSSTYRQSSVARPELLDRDPYNTWLARQNRLRVEAEIIRDVALAASGLLESKIGGPSIRPPQPPGVSEVTYAGQAKWSESTGPDRYRRGMYIWFQRTSPYPTLVAFDAPDANLTCVRRERSNTPLQALTLLNDVVFAECAQSLGRRMMADVGGGLSKEETDESFKLRRIGYAFRLCLGREPSAREMNVLAKLYDDILAENRTGSSASEKTISLDPSDDATSGSEADPAETAACVAVARAIINLDEFITRE